MSDPAGSPDAGPAVPPGGTDPPAPVAAGPAFADPADPADPGHPGPPDGLAAVIDGVRTSLPSVTLPDAAPESDRSARSLQVEGVAFGIGGLFVIAAAAWLFTQAQPVLVVGVALATVVVADAVIASRALTDVDGHVDNPGEAVVGLPVDLVLQLRGLRRPVEVRVAGTPAAGTTLVASEAPVLLGVPLHRRGVVNHVVLDVRGVGPFGLFSSTRRLRAWFPRPLHVAPMPLPHPLRWPTPRATAVGLSPVARTGEDLFRGVRPYVRGDAPRWVHWPASAHHGGLMVKEHEGTGTVTIQLVAWLPAPGPPAELALGRVAWLALESLRQGWRVRLVTAEAATPPPPPGPLRPSGALRAPPPPPLQGRTVDRPVTTAAELARRLALAGYGPVRHTALAGFTRTVTPGGDRWD